MALGRLPALGLSEALGKLDVTTAQMTEMVGSLNRIVDLLEEQNDLMRRNQV